MVFRDETDVRKKKKTLKESEAKFSAIFQYSPVGVTISKASGEIFDVNNIFLQTTGFTKNEVSSSEVLPHWNLICGKIKVTGIIF